MQTPRSRILALLLVLSSVARVQADPFSEMSGFSVFPSVEPANLLKPMTKRGSEMSVPRDLAVQCCYVVQAPLQKAAELDAHWDVMRHPELKVYMHTNLPDKPGLADFERIAKAPANSAVSSFAAATEKLNPDQPQLQMSKEEAKLFAKPAAASPKGRMSEGVAKFWSNLLYQRTQRYLSGGLEGLPVYNAGSETIRASAEAARLLKEQGKIRDQFRTLIAETPLGGGRGRPTLYWELFDVEGQAAACLGASYKKMVGDSRQSVDIQYYASGGYYVLLTFQQMWPITFNGKPATLVWRGDMVSSTNLSNLHGVERVGSGMAMMKTVQKAAAAFQKDAIANP